MDLSSLVLYFWTMVNFFVSTLSNVKQIFDSVILSGGLVDLGVELKLFAGVKYNR
ncbi:hypothetical protein D3C85_1054080 [compost metagenome]